MEGSFQPFDKGVSFDQTRRNLPHRTQEGCTYFLTWRQADCVPKEVLEEWKAERIHWLANHPFPWDDKTQRDYDIRFVRRIERWGDKGLGTCLLKTPDVRKMVVEALHFFDHQRYDLDSYVVMPNHVHVLVTPLVGHSLSAMLHSWKSFTAHTINKTCGRAGAVWMDETFNHAVRSLAQRERFRCYIRDNPSNAFLEPHTFTHWQRDSVT